MSRQQTVLVIDDDPEIVRWISVILTKLGVRVLTATDGGAGLAAAQKHRPDLILLDLNMPVLHGFGVCEALRGHPRTGDIPIIVLTGVDDREGKVKAFGLGAVDYVTKPFDVPELQARVRAVLRMQALVEALEIQASTDHLTGLPNREAFRRSLQSCVQARSEGLRQHFAVLFLDLDRFKVINDSMGHAIGDQLLVSVAERLRRCVRPPEDGALRGDRVVARMGGDEFTILLSDIPDADAAIACAERVRAEFATPCSIGGYTIGAGVSIGVRIIDGNDPEAIDADVVLRDADNAMYHAKSTGKNRYAVFDAAMHQLALRRLQIEHELHHALERDEFVLHYQPVYSAETGRLSAFESLVRWRHPQNGLIYPGEFIEITEDNGLIVDLGRWILRHACERRVAWAHQFPDHDFSINVNVSKQQIISPGFVEDVEHILAETRVNPKHLCLELTESVIMHDVQTVLPLLHRIRAMGVSLAMDDFGTGYSSLASLHRFPIDVVKIDRAFIQPMTTSRVYSAIVDAIINLAHNLDMKVVAEGVEVPEQLVQLQTLECDHVQGFLFSAGLPEEAISELLTERDPWPVGTQATATLPLADATRAA